MGRKSKLTAEQWQEIERRMLKGEATRQLAREFGVSESTIRERKSAQVAEIKTIATQIVAAEQSLTKLPVSAQISALNLADELRAISTHLAGAAKFGAATAHRLSGIAHANVQKIDDATPLDAESLENLRGVAVLTKMANEAATIGTNLLAANKETIRELNSGAAQSKDELLREIATLLPN